MANRKEISLDIRKLIIKLSTENNSVRKISAITGVCRSTVQNIITRFRESNQVENQPRTGRKKKITIRTERVIINEVRKNSKINASELAKIVQNDTQITIHPQTVRRILHKNGYHSRTPRRKPLISENNRSKRITFAKTHKERTESFWNSVLFSDESKFNLHGSDGRAKVWRKRGTALNVNNMISTIKHGGGSVMVWGCMAASGVGNLVFINENMDKHKYLSILQNNLKPSVEKLGLCSNWVFQHDNDPKHTAYLVKEWLLYNVPKQLNSPPQSPDLNPIEHLWEFLERKIRKHKISNKKDLELVLKEEWQKITPENTARLVNSMPKRMKAVLDQKGYPTKY